jgi:RHS repeat-associated protein
MAGGAMIGVRVLHNSDQTVSTRYFHTDNLGSIAVITDESGTVVERDGYDAWGKRRFPTGQDDPSGSITSQTTRGFTGQEELDDVGLVHLNGRVYDPLVGRMMSADPDGPRYRRAAYPTASSRVGTRGKTRGKNKRLRCLITSPALLVSADEVIE